MFSVPCICYIRMGCQNLLVAWLQEISVQHFTTSILRYSRCFVIDISNFIFQGVVHRSLRSSHILISDTGAAVLSGLRWSSDIALRGERILFFGPNTNMNNIRNQNFDRIRIQIIFVFPEWANTNTNNIRAQIFGRIRIRIIFGFRIVPEYEYE